MTATQWQALSTSNSLTLDKLVRSRASMKRSNTSGTIWPCMDAPLRKLAKASKRSTHCVMESAPKMFTPTRAAEEKSLSASGEAPRLRPSFVRARHTHVNSCGFNWATSSKHLGIKACKASPMCSAAMLPIAFCFSNAHNRFAIPWGWICCISTGDAHKCSAAPAKRRSWRAPSREKAHVVMDNSCNLNSGSNICALQPMSYNT
mmetsp:Transcript_130728/g.419303  ORF Transcript_130728/g.419303 Transcript_130728/m.419303 type:complete len:204 (+) Transcript_130728:1147-1758(+)